MDLREKGSITFENLLVLGRDFLPSTWRNDISFFDYAFSVEAHPEYLTDEEKKKRKKKKDTSTLYNYHWTGHFNLGVGNTRIHLHNATTDVGLVKMEEKLLLARSKLDTFLAEYKKRIKKLADNELTDRTWLNEEGSHYTGHVTYKLDKFGSGHFAIADCHRTIHWWVDALWVNDDGSPSKHDKQRQKTIKALEGFGKGLDKAVRAIQELRKFFNRELDLDGP